MTNYEAEATKPQVVSRVGLYLPVALLLILCAGWSAFWFYSAQRADAAVTAWLNAENGRGRNWACEGKNIAGYPFRIELACDSVSLRVERSGEYFTAGRLHAVTQIYSPKLILADVSGPLLMRNGDRALRMEWDNLRVSARVSGRLERLSLGLSQAKLSGDSAFIAGARSMEMHLRPSASRPEQDRAIDLALTASDVSIPGADAWSANQDKANIEFSLTATQASELSASGMPQILESWRASGGKVFIEKGRIGKGSFTVDGEGMLNLDSLRRLEGQLNIKAKGLRPMIAQFASGNVTQMLAPLLDRPDGVQLPLRLQDGRMSLGPIRLPAQIPPLY